MNPSTCSYCGVRIVWGQTPEGKRIPLDPRAPVYQYVNGEARLIPLDARDGGVRTAMVSHFSTCAQVTRKGQPPRPLGPGGQPK